MNRRCNTRPDLPPPHRIATQEARFAGTVRRELPALRRVIVACLVTLMVTVSAKHVAANPGNPHSCAAPRILVLRGLFEVFSLGMNDLAAKLRALGYDAETGSWSMSLLEVDCADNRPVVVVGHSFGGRACGWVSRELRQCGQRVPLIIIVDSNLVMGIPDNVDRCVHLYVTNSLGVFHGSPVYGESPTTQVVNWDVSKGQQSHIMGVNHFNIDATDWVHQLIINEIARVFPPPRHPGGVFNSMVVSNGVSFPPHLLRGGNQHAGSPPFAGVAHDTYPATRQDTVYVQDVPSPREPTVAQPYPPPSGAVPWQAMRPTVPTYGGRIVDSFEFPLQPTRTH